MRFNQSRNIAHGSGVFKHCTLRICLVCAHTRKSTRPVNPPSTPVRPPFRLNPPCRLPSQPAPCTLCTLWPLGQTAAARVRRALSATPCSAAQAALGGFERNGGCTWRVHADRLRVCGEHLGGPNLRGARRPGGFEIDSLATLQGLPVSRCAGPPVQHTKQMTRMRLRPLTLWSSPL